MSLAMKLLSEERREDPSDHDDQFRSSEARNCYWLRLLTPTNGPLESADESLALSDVGSDSSVPSRH